MAILPNFIYKTSEIIKSQDGNVVLSSMRDKNQKPAEATTK